MMMAWDEIPIAHYEIQSFLSLDKYRLIYVSVNVKIVLTFLTERRNLTIRNIIQMCKPTLYKQLEVCYAYTLYIALS